MEIKIRHPGDPTDWLAVELIPQRGRRKPAFFKVEVTAFGSSVTLFLTQPDVQQLATALEGYLAGKARATGDRDMMVVCKFCGRPSNDAGGPFCPHCGKVR